MGKLLVGFLAGVAVSVAAVAILDGPVTILKIQTADDPMLSSEHSFRQAAIQQEVEGPPTTQRERQSDNPPETDAQTIGLGDFEARRQEAFRRRNEAQELLNQRTAELTAIQTEKWRLENPIVSPLALPSEFTWLANSIQQTSYDHIQRQARDPNWSAPTEAKIAEYLSQHPEITDVFGYPTVLECRTSECGLTFQRYSEDEWHESTALLTGMFSDFLEQESDMGLPDVGTSEANKQDGLTTIYWTMTSSERAMAPLRARCNQPEPEPSLQPWCAMYNN